MGARQVSSAIAWFVTSRLTVAPLSWFITCSLPDADRVPGHIAVDGDILPSRLPVGWPTADEEVLQLQTL